MNISTLRSLSTKKSVKIFLDHVSDQINKLNDLDSIEVDDPVLVAVEVKARKLAKERIKGILAPLIEITEDKVEFNKNDYTVDPDDIDTKK